MLKTVWESLTNLPGLILDGIKSIFIPESGNIQQIFDDTLNDIKSKTGIHIFDLNTIVNGSSPPSDIEGSYNGGLWSYTGKFVDFTFLITAVNHFRPYIRGFLVLLLAIFNVRQFLSIFGLSSGEIKSAESQFSMGGTKDGH